MYYVQYRAMVKGGDYPWVIDKKFTSLEAALGYAVEEAQDAHTVPHRVIKITKRNKVKVLAKFKPLGDA